MKYSFVGEKPTGSLSFWNYPCISFAEQSAPAVWHFSIASERASITLFLFSRLLCFILLVFQSLGKFESRFITDGPSLMMAQLTVFSTWWCYESNTHLWDCTSNFELQSLPTLGSSNLRLSGEFGWWQQVSHQWGTRGEGGWPTGMHGVLPGWEGIRYSRWGEGIFNLQMFRKSLLRKVYSKSRNRCLFGDSYLSKIDENTNLGKINR